MQKKIKTGFEAERTPTEKEKKDGKDDAGSLHLFIKMLMLNSKFIRI